MRRRDWLAALAATAFAQGAPRITKITGAADHALVLYSTGAVGGWGDLRDGQLGPRAAIPAVSGHAAAYVPIALPGPAIDLASTGRTAAAVLEDGTVAVWGSGANGELGGGEETRDGTETPRLVPGLTGIAEVSVGQGHVLARTTAGGVLAWGKLAFGPIYADEEVHPVHPVAGLTDAAQVVATSIAAVLRRDGTVWVWGRNGDAQFGNGRRSPEERTRVPVRVPGVAEVVHLSGGANGRHFLGRRRDGALVAWGNTDWGQVGNGLSGVSQPAPITLPLKGVRQAYAVGAVSYAEDAAGQWWIWGLGSVYGAWPMRPNALRPVRWSIPEGIRRSV